MKLENFMVTAVLVLILASLAIYACRTVFHIIDSRDATKEALIEAGTDYCVLSKMHGHTDYAISYRDLRRFKSECEGARNLDKQMESLPAQ